MDLSATAATALSVTMTFTAAALMIVIMAMATTAFMLFLMIVPTAATATAVSMAMLVAMPPTALGYSNSFELTTFELGDGFFDDFGIRAIDLNALIEQITQRHAVDTGAQNGINWGAFLFGFFVYWNRGDSTGFGIEDDQMTGIGEVRFGGRLQAIGFQGWDTELHGVSSELGWF